MRFFKVYFILIIFLFSVDALAGGLKEIQLKDGSILYGKVISLVDDEFTIESPSLGNIKIAEDKVHAVVAVDITREETKALQERMMEDEDILKIIVSLQDDPDVQAVLKDETLMKALNEGDMQILVSSPEFLKLFENPKFKEILDMIMK